MVAQIFLSLHICVTILLLNLIPAYSEENMAYQNCKEPFDCGLVGSLSYPFWGTIRSRYCGHNGFDLMCNDGQYPVIGDRPDEFRLVKVDQNSRMMTIELINPSQYICPRSSVSKTLNSSFLSQAGTDTHLQSLNLLYNCTNTNNIQNPIPIDACEGWGRSFLTIGNWSGGNDDQYPVQCASTIKIPATQQAVDQLRDGVNGSSDLRRFLEQRIDISYEYGAGLTVCQGCMSSGGFCGSRMNDSSIFICLCPNENSPDVCPPRGRGGKVTRKVIIGVVAGGAGILSSIFIYLAVMRNSSIRSIFSPGKRATNNQDLEKVIRLHGSLAIKRYNFSEVKRITNRFKDKLGQGGYGSVFKGKLADGRLVAVKILNDSTGNGEEFINEVASISRTSHVNIVNLAGFCLEGSKRVLIYDFMPNGSLEKFINKGSTRHLGLEILYRIALGVARGLEYLHSGCNTRIVHFDIKPHNILLDEDFCPKIADFGLARLCNRKQSIMSMWETRGTVGYIAPEVFCRHFGGVSHKSDVYSYGMMILEMVGERENDDTKADDSIEAYFPHWIYKRLELQEHELHGAAAVEEIETPRKLAIVGLWCIQINPLDRPSISKVIEMLEGPLEFLMIPPQPLLPSPAQSPYYSSNAPTP